MSKLDAILGRRKRQSRPVIDAPKFKSVTTDDLRDLIGQWPSSNAMRFYAVSDVGETVDVTRIDHWNSNRIAYPFWALQHSQGDDVLHGFDLSSPNDLNFIKSIPIVYADPRCIQAHSIIVNPITHINVVPAKRARAGHIAGHIDFHVSVWSYVLQLNEFGSWNHVDTFDSGRSIR